MPTPALGLFALIAALALLEVALWRKRRRRRAEIDAFMEWHSYPPGRPEPVRLRHLSEDAHDAMVEHFIRLCPVALCHEDADTFFAGLCRIVDREIERAVADARLEGAAQGR